MAEIISHSPSVGLNNEGPQTPLKKEPLLFEQDIHDIKSKDNFRMEFLRKLSDEKVWVPPNRRSPKHQSLIIFDWDDTLMYTSFILHGKSHQALASPVTREHLQSIEKAVYSLLDTALGLGHTFIITNAQQGWVEECVARYMPSLKQILEKVRIISARTEHEAEYPDLNQWKRRAFSQLGKQLDKETITNLISIGDSKFEMEAVHLLGQQFSKALVKTVKLQECPTPEELCKELALIVPKLQAIVEKASSMKITLERRHSR